MEYDYEVTAGQMIVWCIIFLPIFFVMAPVFFLWCLALLGITFAGFLLIATLGAKIDKILERNSK